MNPRSAGLAYFIQVRRGGAVRALLTQRAGADRPHTPSRTAAPRSGARGELPALGLTWEVCLARRRSPTRDAGDPMFRYARAVSFPGLGN